MKEIVLRYNPFEAKASCQYNGKDKLPKCMGNGENCRLQDWLYEFFPNLSEMHNWGEGTQYKISFHGTPGDFEDLEHAKDIFSKDNQKIQIQLNHINKESKTMNNRLSDLRNIFEKMQKESPYDELKDPKLKPRFDQALSSIFEISVIATMSSGKSTLINAMLGQEILPARNVATTAKIADIYDDNNTNGWLVRGLKKNENDEYFPCTNQISATIEELEKLNDSNEIDKIEIRGKIPGINSREMHLLISDTPGPNNSKTNDHSKHIDDLIMADYKPMIMYILNTQQLEINDDKSLLERIAYSMKGSGKQGADRYLFVINKADEFDPEKNEFIDKIIKDCEDYLKRFGIYGARIFPASAQLAKLIRMSNAGRTLTLKEKQFLGNKELFIEQKELHFSDFVINSLSPSCRKKQDEILKKAIIDNDKNTQALIYSGLPAIELAIDEYLEKYAITSKISKAVGVFINIINRLDLKNKTEIELSNNEEKRREVSLELKKLKKQIENGGEAKKLKDKFDEDIYLINKKLEKSYKEHETEINRLLTDESENYNDNDISQSRAKEIINKTRRSMELKYATFSSDLSMLFERELKRQAQNYINEYRQYIEGLVKTEDFTLSATINLIQMTIPDSVDDLIEKFEGKKIINKTVKHSSGNPNKRWYKPWTWFDEHYREWTEIEKSEKSIIKMNELFSRSIRPQFNQFFTMIEKAKTVAINNSQELKEYFSNEIKNLDNALKETIQKETDSIETKKVLEQKINENKSKAEWLEKFIEELESILEV